MKSTPLRSFAIGSAAITAALALSSCADPRQGGASTTGPFSAMGDAGGGQAGLPPAAPRRTSDYPLATPVEGTRDQVISPYKPHNVIDVKGFRTGQLARDPSTAPVDPTTGKPDMNQAKIFEIP